MLNLTRLFNEFYNCEKAGRLILVIVTLLSLGFANSSFGNGYIGFWHTNLGGHDVVHWISDGSEKSPSFLLQHFLHKPVAFIILPLFAAANTCIPLAGNILEGMTQKYRLGIFAGLDVGKPLGVLLFSFIAVSLGFCTLPAGLNGKRISGAGFTMSVFITLLAFRDTEIVNNSKIAILAASIISGVTGFILLKRTLKEA
jgi:Na+:H+ antiporter, NhaA family